MASLPPPFPSAQPPSPCLSLSVGGATLHAIATQSRVALQTGHPDMRFLGEADAPGLRLEIAVQTLPDPPNDNTLFRSGETWQLYRTGDDLWLRLEGRAGSAGPGRAVRLAPDLTCGTLYIAPEPAGWLSRDGDRYVVDPFAFPLAELIFHWLLAKAGGTCLHASGVSRDGRGCVFCGVSEAGKSTIAGLMQAAGWTVLSDDRIALNRAGLAFRIHGTPWHGTPELAQPGSATLAGVFFIEHAKENTVQRLAPGEACAMLVGAACPPYFSAELMERFMDACAKAAQMVPCYKLGFVPEASVAELVAEALKCG